MEKITTDEGIAEIKKLLKGKKTVIGTERTLKDIKLGKISKVYLSANCAEKTVEAIEHYSRLGKVVVIRLKYPSDELGILCKKPFAISVLSVVK